MIFPRILQLSAIFLFLSSPVMAQDERANPEGSSPAAAHEQTATAIDFMIVTANPYATKAGYEILERGGSAADAAIAAQLVLGLVEPQSSGLGGGAFILYYDAKTQELKSYDARETAPGLAGPFLFYENGEALDFKTAQLSGKSIGVPGVPKLLAYLHQVYGQRTWMELFNPAIDLAEAGFQISPRLEAMIKNHASDLQKFPQTAAYFFDGNGQPLKTGAQLKNPAYAETLKDMAFTGANIFYEGPLASQIVKTVQNVPQRPGFMTGEDLRGYDIKARQPVCAPYRLYVVCSMGEPSSGGLSILQALGMLEGYDLRALGADNPRSWSLIAQASALAFADRNMYMADPDFVNTPGVLLLDPAYMDQRRALIDPARPLQDMVAEAGKPPLWDGSLFSRGNSIDKPGTSHISVVDKEGNVLSMTTTIESAFGSHQMVGGFLLNNELTDFSFRSFGEDDALIANMVEGGKRPRSSMAPVIIFDLAGKPVLTLGSAGGSRIIGYVLQRIIAVLDWDMDIDQAISMAHIIARSEKNIEVEEMSDISRALEKNGHHIKQGSMNSGLTAIRIKRDNLIGSADPRREGMALGN